MIPFANILQPLIDVFDAVLRFFHDSVGLSWGTSIIALTVAVRIVLLPLTLKQFRSMQALQTLAPEIKKLQEKYKDDRQRLNQEMMKFYQENKVNPFGSCLPLVAQLPVFISLFYMLRKDLRFDICGQIAKPCSQVPPGNWGENFFFIPDITDKATGSVLVVLLVLYVGSQLLSSVLMSVTADRNQRMLMIALPFVFVPFITSFPAGLLLYWITTNIWTVAQQTIIRKRAGMPVGFRSRPAPEPAPAAVANPKGKAGGGGRNGAAAGETATPQRRSAAPPPPPRARKKKKTGRRR
ncbi:MAG TPA: YidC/Oxa1 family membrane protein insertase [Solirubrobacteraceae bacterium]|nr:YidC/Oxa1 family membrane protein insertase [Solirubrobacteraceae bacterium]